MSMLLKWIALESSDATNGSANITEMVQRADYEIPGLSKDLQPVHATCPIIALMRAKYFLTAV